MNDERQAIRAILRANSPVGAHTEPGLRAAVETALENTGGLLRPQLARAVARATGAEEDFAAGVTTAIEYFHVASLILDDLPCMDDAALRRGRPATHVVHGEATAILAALALISRAHFLIGAAAAPLPPARRLAVQACVESCLGAAGVIDGQARDLAFGAQGGGAREVLRVARRKTAALFELALLLPALGGEISTEETAALHRLALLWGLAYQGADDLIDVCRSTVEAGKSTGRDQAQRRPNLALVLGVAVTRRRLARQVRLAAAVVARLRALDPRWAVLEPFQAGLAARGDAAALFAAA